MGIEFAAVDVTKLLPTNSEIMRAVAEAQLEAANARAEEGIESDDAPARGYSERYAARREKEGLQTSTRDFRRTGDMLDSREILDVTENSARIGWASWNAAAYFTDKQTPWIKPTFDERITAIGFADTLIRENLQNQLEQLRAAKG